MFALVRSKIQNNRSYSKLAYISDIHLEVWKPKHKAIFKYGPNAKPEKIGGLLLAGDIGNPFHKNYKDFLQQCSQQFPNVFFISGNHEYHQKKGVDANEKIKEVVYEIERKTGKDNLYYLDNSKILINNYHLLLGTTLWCPHRNKAEYNFSVDWLEWQLHTIINPSEVDEHHLIKPKYVTVMSHYLPTKKLISEDYLRRFKNHKNFYSDLDRLIDRPVTHWICGHSHSVMTMDINGVFMGMNTFGYLPRLRRQQRIRRNNYEVELPLKYITY